MIGMLSVMLSACWADFPSELLDPDAPQPDTVALDTTFDLADGPRPDMAGDAPILDGPILDGPVPDGVAPDVPDGPSPDGPPDGPLPDVAPPDAVWPVLKALGAVCGGASECYSGYCIDGVCCNGACAGPCVACNLASTLGRCLPLAQGQVDGSCMAQPKTTCGLEGVCDGEGACRKWAAGTVCANPSCSGSSNEKVTLPSVCDGAGICNPLGEVDCSPYRCNLSNWTCYPSCGGSGGGQCVPGKSCNSGKCDNEKQPDGTSCTYDGQCESNICKDGVCCGSSCTGTCRTCKIPLSLQGSTTIPYSAAGICFYSLAGVDPDGECSPTAKHTCGTDGTCNGNGACRLHVQGTICETQVCDLNAVPGGAGMTPFYRCDGSGNCDPDGLPTSCGNYTCMSGFSCYGQCTSSSHCKTGSACDMTGHVCQ